MITIIAKNIIKPGMVEEFKKTAQPLIAASQKETGCIFYDLYEDINDPNILTFIERWEDGAAIDAHNSSEHFTKIVPQLGAFREESQVHLYKMI